MWTHVSILHGGSQPWNGNDDSDASVFLDNDNIRLTVTDSRIADSDAAGIRIELDAVNDDVSFERVAFDNTEEPVKTSPAGVASLGADLTFSGNDDTVIRVLAGDLNEDATWLNHGIDYALPVGMDVYADLTLSPGSQLRFGPGARLRISDAISGGVLIADAEGGDPILFSGMEQTPGYWLGISLNTATGSNVLHNTRIEYAGSNSWNGNPDNIGALFLQSGSRLELRDTTFANNLGDSDVLVAGASTVISGCTNITGTFRGDAQATFCTQ